MLHTLTYTSKLTVRGTSKNETLRQKISYTRSFNFPIISLSWYDIPELVVPIRIYLIEDYCSANKEATEPRVPIYIGFKLKSSLRKFYVATMIWLTVMEYLCHKWPCISGADPGFQDRGALKKMRRAERGANFFFGISCEKSRFYAKKSYFFQF
jgi:hypothetical protein